MLLIALIARLQPWTHVFPADVPGAVFVGDTDTYYHALRAERIAAAFPAIPWTDPGMNYPDGADILWPPLFDTTIAGISRLVPGGPPTRETVERVAALLPPVLGFATVGLVALLGFILFRDGTGTWAGLFLALLPIHVEFSTVGRPDQHAAESLLQSLVMLTFVAAWRTSPTRRWWWQVALGATIALSFWNWQGSALYLILLCAFVAIWQVSDGDGADEACQVLAGGCAIGAVLLAMSITAWGRTGALLAGSLSGINGIQAALTALAAAFATALAVARHVRRATTAGLARRVAEVALAAVIPVAAALLLFPLLGDGIRQGLVALSAGNRWYASIREFQPPLFGGLGIRHELASWLPRFAPMFVMPLAAVGLFSRWRRCPGDRPALAFVATWGAPLLLATLFRLRFALYLSAPAVLWSAVALGELARAASSRRVLMVRAAAAVLLLTPALFYFSHGGLWPDPEQREVARALEWLRQQPASDGNHAAVFSEWDWGHLVQYFGRRPAIATPFGTDGGTGALEDTARFFLSTSPEAAERLLRRRRSGYLLLVDPLNQAASFAPYGADGGDPPVRVDWDAIDGPRLIARPEVDDLVPVRLYYDNGLSSRGLPTLTRYRLVYEGAPDVERQVRLFQLVAGAELAMSGAGPGQIVRARTQLRTNRGREAQWDVETRADASGSASLRVPFTTGANGAVMVVPYRVTCGGSGIDVLVDEDAVETGKRIDVPCAGPR